MMISKEEEDESEELKLSAENLKEFQEIFSLVDKDGGGSISAEEVTQSFCIVFYFSYS